MNMFIPQVEHLRQAIGLELFYASVIIACCFLIYHGTKELYNLSNHKGIQFFRLAFLFFGISFFFRYLIKAILAFFSVNPQAFLIIGPITTFAFLFFSFLAVLFLIYSLLWEKFKEKDLTPFIISLSLVVALLGSILKSPTTLLTLNLLVFVLMIILVFVAFKKSKSKKNDKLYLVYILLFVFWIIQEVDVLIPFFMREIQILIYILSTFCFLAILYRVLKVAGN